MIFDDEILQCNIEFSADYKRVFINGIIKNKELYSKIMLIAPNPIDRMTNYSGSGLPFPCSNIAFENTPNKIIVNDGIFSTTFLYPNSFYLVNGRDKIISSIFFVFYGDSENVIETKRVELHDLLVLRTLNNRTARKTPEFYAAKDYLLPIDTAEIVMREYSRFKIENDIG